MAPNSTKPANNNLAEMQKALENEVNDKETQNLAAPPLPSLPAEPEVPPSVFQSEGTPTPVVPTSPSPAPVSVPKNPTQAFTEDALNTKKILDTYPKMWISLPCYIGEKAGVSEDYASINGYRYTVKKGVMVEVPTPIGKLFMDHYNIQQGETDFGKTMRLDRNEKMETTLS
jgi:hypothetical protein